MPKAVQSAPRTGGQLDTGQPPVLLEDLVQIVRCAEGYERRIDANKDLAILHWRPTVAQVVDWGLGDLVIERQLERAPRLGLPKGKAPAVPVDVVELQGPDVADPYAKPARENQNSEVPFPGG